MQIQQAMVEVNSVNLPMSKRGVRRSQDRVIPALWFITPVLAIALAFIMIQISSFTHKRRRKKAAQELKEGTRVMHATRGEGVICGDVAREGEGKPYGVQYDNGERHAHLAITI